MADRWAGVLGAAVLAVAVLLLGVGLLTVYEIAKDPSARLPRLSNQLSVSVAGPNASFRWASQGYNVTFTDTSTDNGSVITTWAWDFGDNSGFSGRSPPTHTYAVSCPMCTEQVTLGVKDAAGRASVATATVVVQQHGASSGVGQSPEVSTPNLGPLTSGLPGTLELLVVMFLIGGSVAKAGWNLLRREPEAVKVPVRPTTVP